MNKSNNIFKITLLISLFFSISAFANSNSGVDNKNNTNNSESEFLEVSDLGEACDYLTKAYVSEVMGFGGNVKYMPPSDVTSFDYGCQRTWNIDRKAGTIKLIVTKALYRDSHAAASSYYSNMLNSSYLRYEPVSELGELALWNPMMNVIDYDYRGLTVKVSLSINYGLSEEEKLEIVKKVALDFREFLENK